MVLTDAPIFSLPGKEVQERSQRLPDQTKGDPKDRIAQDFPIDTLHLLQRQRHYDQWDLHHHTDKCNSQDIMRGNTDEEFVQHAAEDKDRHACRGGTPAAADKGAVDMSTHEVVDRLVPGAPIRAYGGGIPPFCIEFAVAEAHDLREAVERGLKCGEEAGQPDDEGDR